MELQDYLDAKLVHEIHTSERKSFRACRRRWDWIFRHNYYPKITAKPLEFGVAYHKAMETYYNPATWDWDREVIGQQAIIDFAATCEEQKQALLKNTGQLYLDAEVEEDYTERVELGRGMLNYYFTDIAPKEDVGWKPVKVEIKFMIPIPNPETGEELIWCKCDQCWEKWLKQPEFWAEEVAACNNELEVRGKDYRHDDEELRQGHFKGLPVVYAGRLDALGEDDDGNYWVIDWKTAAQIREDHEFLELDDQVMSYVWALIRMGIPVRGFIYHEQRKAFPIPPKQNKTTRLGRKFSVSKSEPYEYQMYLQTVSTEDKQAYEDGLYDEMLEFLQSEGPKFYARYQIYKSADEVDEAERNIGYEALDMIDQNLRIYPSPGRFGCSFCAFRVPCIEQNSKGDYQYALDTMFEKMEHYYVRQEASTESKGGE